MQIQISWLLQKPTELDLHCLLRQGMSCSAREGLSPAVFYKAQLTFICFRKLMFPQAICLTVYLLFILGWANNNYWLTDPSYKCTKGLALLNEPQRVKTYLRTCAPAMMSNSVDPDQMSYSWQTLHV